MKQVKNRTMPERPTKNAKPISLSTLGGIHAEAGPESFPGQGETNKNLGPSMWGIRLPGAIVRRKPGFQAKRRSPGG